MPIDYKNGKIYKLVSNQTDDVYIGSTCLKLCSRMAKHRCDYKHFKEGKKHFVSSFDIMKFDDAKILLVEDFPCDRREQLLKREGEIIKNTQNCINRCVAGRTKKDRAIEFKEEIKQYMDQYRLQNKETLSAKKKVYYSENKDTIKERRLGVVTCECGIEIRKVNIAKHIKTRKHNSNIIQK